MQNIGVFGHLMMPAAPGKGLAGEDKRAKGEDKRAKSQIVAEAAPARAPAPAEADEVGAAFKLKKDAAGSFADKESQAAQPPDLIQPSVRTKFADSAYWSGNVITDQKGMAQVEFNMPESARVPPRW
jgi:hypothetical protein